MVNYYRDHVPRRAHILAPLTSQTKQKKFIKWDDACDVAFNTCNAQLARECMLAFPDPAFPYVIEPNASN